MTELVQLVPAARRPRRRISVATRRRLARMSRAAHRFHRFAHHPLCDRYAGEVVRVGRVRLCRGCAYAAIGGLVGGIAGVALASVPDTTVAVVTMATLATAAATALLLATLWIRARVTKLVTRLVPAALYAFAITCGALSLQPLGFASACAAMAVVGGLRLLYGKRGADRTPCTTCPELDVPDSRSLGRTAETRLEQRAPCSGFAPIVSRERAFQRVARRLIT